MCFLGPSPMHSGMNSSSTPRPVPHTFGSSIEDIFARNLDGTVAQADIRPPVEIDRVPRMVDLSKCQTRSSVRYRVAGVALIPRQFLPAEHLHKDQPSTSTQNRVVSSRL